MNMALVFNKGSCASTNCSIRTPVGWLSNGKPCPTRHRKPGPGIVTPKRLEAASTAEIKLLIFETYFKFPYERKV